MLALFLVTLSLLSAPLVQTPITRGAKGSWPLFHQNAQHTGLSPYPGPAFPVLAWIFQTGGPVESAPAIGNGRIYIGSDDGNLYALNPQGKPLWKFQTGCPVRTTAAVGSDGTIYLGACISNRPENILYAINPSGTMKWNLTIPPKEGLSRGILSPTIGPDGVIYISDFDFTILAVRPDGSVKWTMPTFGEVWDPPALAPDGTVYVGIDDPGPDGSCGQCLLAINADGSVKWTAGFTRDIQGPSPAIGLDGTVYIGGAAEGAFFAINPDGTLKWEFPHSAGTFSSSPSIGPDGTIYVSGHVGVNQATTAMEAFYPNGTLRWERLAGTDSANVYFSQSSAIIDSNGNTYFTNQNSTSRISILNAVNPNGDLIWQFATGPMIGSDPIAMGADGTIYFASSDGNLYAIN